MISSHSAKRLAQNELRNEVSTLALVGSGETEDARGWFAFAFADAEEPAAIVTDAGDGAEVFLPLTGHTRVVPLSEPQRTFPARAAVAAGLIAVMASDAIELAFFHNDTILSYALRWFV